MGVYMYIHTCIYIYIYIYIYTLINYCLPPPSVALVERARKALATLLLPVPEKRYISFHHSGVKLLFL